MTNSTKKIEIINGKQFLATLHCTKTGWYVKFTEIKTKKKKYEKI